MSRRFCLFAVFGEGGRRQQEINTAFPTPGRGAQGKPGFYFQARWLFPSTGSIAPEGSQWSGVNPTQNLTYPACSRGGAQCRELGLSLQDTPNTRSTGQPPCSAEQLPHQSVRVFPKAAPLGAARGRGGEGRPGVSSIGIAG